MNTMREYTRVDERQISVSQAAELFAGGTFIDEGNDLFSDAELDKFMTNITRGLPVPVFGAREDEDGNPHFKSGKFRQVVEACLKLADSGTLNAVSSRKLRTVPFKVVSVSETEFYNPGITKEEIDQVLYFCL